MQLVDNTVTIAFMYIHRVYAESNVKDSFWVSMIMKVELGSTMANEKREKEKIILNILEK